MAGVDYIEAARQIAPLYTPSDTGAIRGQLAHLNRMHVFEGWDSAKGDTSVVIGILDTGFDILHPDLAGNVAHNRADPINGVDDDHNGYVDDYNGYDLASRDNDPRPDANQRDGAHGTAVASISSAVTNNVTGVAGLGFKCRFLPVKVFSSTRSAGYEGIIYAADRGCKVLNLSWGSDGGPTQFEQDVIDYAVLVKGCVLVAAAGNAPGTTRYFPASYRGVISVGFTELSDVRNANCTTSPDMDLTAPGSNVYGITSTGAYGNIGGGSSFAAPMVAALAGLVRAQHPTLSAAEVEVQLKAGSDWIDTIPLNRSVAGFLGKGRINFRKTLTAASQTYIQVTGAEVDDRNANLSVGIAPLYISMRTMLAFARRVTVHLAIWDTSASPGTRIEGPDSLILENLPQDAEIQIRPSSGWTLSFDRQQMGPVQLLVTLNVDGRESHQVVTIAAGFASQDLIGPSGRLTAAANARLGYLDNRNAFGAGFTRLGRRVLGEGGILIAHDSLDVRDNVSSAGTKDDDFSGFIIKTVQADTLQVMESVSTSAPAPGRLSLALGFKGYAWPNRADRPGIITEYTAVNTGSQSIDSLRFGILADWDINRYWLNQMRWDSIGGFGYAYAYGDTAYAALVPLTPNMRHDLFAIDVVPLSTGGNINVTDGFTRPEKWQALRQHRRSAGGQAGTNVVGIHQTVLPTIPVEGKQRIAYAWVAGPSLNALHIASQQSRAAYRILRQGRSWPYANQFSICAGDSLHLVLPKGRWRIADSLGQEIAVARRTFASLLPPETYQTLRISQAEDSLFAGPEALVTIYTRTLQDTFNVADTVQVGDAVDLYFANGQPEDSIQVFIENLSTHRVVTLYNPTNLVLDTAGKFSICRSISTMQGCRSERCDTVTVLARPSAVRPVRLTQLLPYPNPAKDVLHVQVENASSQTIRDALGRTVWQSSTSGMQTLLTTTWPRGMYIWQGGGQSYRLTLQ